MRKGLRLAGVACGAAFIVAFGAGPALAHGSTVQANLSPVAGNGVNGSGTAMVEVNGQTITVTMAAQGLLADQPHAAHIHFGAEARHECPVIGDDSDGDGHLDTTEGAPAYGPVVVSLTKTGDTSAASTLAVDRFDTAKGGKISYQRGSIKVSSAVADGHHRRQVRRGHPRSRLRPRWQVQRQQEERPRPVAAHRGDRPRTVRSAPRRPRGWHGYR